MKRKAKDTLTAFEMDCIETEEFELVSCHIRRIELLGTSARLLEESPKQFEIGPQGAPTQRNRDKLEPVPETGRYENTNCLDTLAWNVPCAREGEIILSWSNTRTFEVDRVAGCGYVGPSFSC